MALILAVGLIIAAVFNGGVYQVRYINEGYGFRFNQAVFTGQLKVRARLFDVVRRGGLMRCRLRRR